MRNGLKSRTVVLSVAVLAAVLLAVLWRGGSPTAGQQRQDYQVPRFPGTAHPDVNGIWQALNTANNDLRRHAARPALMVESVEGREVPAAPVLALGAIGVVPGSIGVVEGGDIPYQPWAAERQRDNFKNALTRDPEVKCFQPGVPRATYLPYPFQIIQTNSHILMAYEFANASRTIYMEDPGESPIDSWMGWSEGRWEGDTLVVDTTGFNDQTWFDRAGNFHSEALHVVERYTRVAPDHMQYEATMEDPKVFTRPWTIRMPLYRHLEPGAQLLESNCVLFSEELLYGHLRKVPARRWEGDFGERGGRMMIEITRGLSRSAPGGQ
jgi:hypothetical protein